MIKFLRTLAVVPAAAALLLIPANAAAANAMTIAPGNAALSARVDLTVPVTVTCPAFDPSLASQGLSLVQETMSVSVEQASGQQIARGSTQTYALTPGPWLFACDGSSKTVQVTVLADPAGPPFHGGSVVASVSASALMGIAFGTGFYCPYPSGCVSQSASTTSTIHVSG